MLQQYKLPSLKDKILQKREELERTEEVEEEAELSDLEDKKGRGRKKNVKKQ